ncbi:MAG TPA: hypothetical protein PKA28_03910 [Methylomusa anaerophila]|uniref:Uncharacterized protein n=1 Tax=Methylomusa anaerophila TaxID=1930071 RepID=A0A348ANC4_9FIRM|nr:hypothetical protein [Methylomusa anaerophila]BBB92572.1 hypothetical protein MAMMFC1_03267 [Methylomusa anaerophila]HML87574.1 hypothetical protein [Methylomusa anaerophila]
MNIDHSKMEKRTFHFNLNHCSKIQNFKLAVGATKYEIKRHTPETIAFYRRENRFLALMAEDEIRNITHYAEEIALPNETVQMLKVTFDTGDTSVNIPGLALMWVHVPAAHRLKHRQKKINAGSKIHHPKVKLLCDSKPFSIDEMLRIYGEADYTITPMDIAVAIVFQHPQLASIDPKTAAIVLDDHIKKAPDLINFANSISAQGPATPAGGWATICPSVDKDGKALTWGKDYPSHKEGDVVYQYKLSAKTLDASGDSLSYSLTSSQDDDALKNITWSVNQGSGAMSVQNLSTSKLLATASDNSGYSFTVNCKTAGCGLTVYDNSLKYSKTDSTFSINVKNNFLRTLSAYVEFYDEAGNVVHKPDNWKENLPDWLQSIFETDSKKFISSVTCVNVILGIPMPTDPTNLSFSWPEEAVSCKIMLGGAGTSEWDEAVDLGGVFLTGIFQFGIPLLFLAAGAVITSTSWFKSFIADKDNVAAALGVTFGIVGGGTATACAVFNVKKVLTILADAIAGIIAGPGLEKLAVYICEKLTEAEMEEAIPYVGMATAIANRAIQFGEITESTVEILCSPATYKVDVNRTLPLQVKIHPDPTHGTAENPAVWPEVSDHYQVIVQYKGGTNFIMTGDMPTTTKSEPLILTFPQLPAGGEIQVSCGIFSETNWLAGKWTSSWVKAELPVDRDILALEGSIQENLVPLTADTYYSYKEKIVYDPVAAAHRWQPAMFVLPDGSDKSLDSAVISDAIRQTFSDSAINLSTSASVQIVKKGSEWKINDGADSYDVKKVQKDSIGNMEIQVYTHNQPLQTVDCLNPSNDGHNLGKLVDITINDHAYMLGYCWMASGQNIIPDGGQQPTNVQMYTFQNINVLGCPEDSLKFPAYGFSKQPYILYDQFGPAPLFAMPIAYETDLDSGKITPQISTLFTTYGYPLPTDATVTIVVQGTEWYVGEPGKQPAYDIRRVTDQLEVHPYPCQPYSPNNFYVDPVGDVYHLRQITLDNETPLDMSRQKSWGCFTEPHMDAFVVHPQGYVLGVSWMNSKMEILKLPDQPTTDDQAAPAIIVAGEGARQGLMSGPVALNVTPDGRVLVLETGNSRIQAFDINGNPVPSFDGSAVAQAAAAFAPNLDDQCVPLALRQVYADAGSPLSEEWNLQDGDMIYNINRRADGLTVTMQGANISQNWQIDNEGTLYQLKISGQQIDVSQNSRTLFTLDAEYAALLDIGITDEVRAAFQAQTITLSPKAQIAGDTFILSAASEETLALNSIPQELIDGLNARLIHIGTNPALHSEVMVIVNKPGQQWLIRDLPQSNAYSVTFDKDHNRLNMVNCLSYMPLYKKTGETDTTYLDMASEIKGYIYVLAYNDDGKKIADYYIDIYEPGGKWLSRTYGVNAGKFIVDMWRNMFTLNFESQLGPGGRTEPSVSEWIPSTPDGN